MRKRKSLNLLIIMFALALLFGTSQIFAEDLTTDEITDANFANVVIYVNFSDTVHNHTYASWSKCFMDNPDIDGLFNGVNTTGSMYHYLKTISNGKLKVKSIFPQLQGDGKITPITLSGTAASYVDNKDGIVMEVAQYIANHNLIPQNTTLDYNQDHMIDNLMLVLPCESGNTNYYYNGLSWTYAGTNYINGKLVKPTNIITESEVYLNIGQSAQAIHECMHTLGFPDLYTPTTAVPVDAWDIMSTLYMQYPLAYMRYSVPSSKWVDNIRTITNNETNITLFSPSAASRSTATQTMKDNQAVILKSPLNDDEFFVVEYRKDSNGDPYDQTLRGDGLIVYRVNNGVEYKSNYRSNKYYVYVYRPGDTYDVSAGREAGKGDLYSSFLSAESGRTSYGTSDMTKGIAGGAITFSDNSNSGIVISNVSSAAGDKITFDVTFPEDTEDTWTSCDTLASMYDIKTCTDDAGNLYVLGIDQDYNSKIYRLENEKLVELCDGPCSYTFDMVCYNNQLYVCYMDYSTWEGKVNVYNDQGFVKTIAFSGDEQVNMDLQAVAMNDGVVIAYTVDATVGSNWRNIIKAVKVSGNEVTALGDNIERNQGYMPSFINLVNVQGKPTLMYREVSNSGTLVLNQYDNNQWQMLDDSKTSSYEKLYSDETGLYLITSDGTQITCYYYDSGWKQLSEETIALSNLFDMDVCSKDGVLYVIATKDDSQQSIHITRTYAVSEKGVKQFGKDPSLTSSSCVDVQTMGEMIYATYVSSTNKALYIKKLKALEDHTLIMGDLDGNGKVEMADAILAKQIAMKQVTATAYQLKAGDMNDDQKITINEARNIRRAALNGETVQ